MLCLVILVVLHEEYVEAVSLMFRYKNRCTNDLRSWLKLLITESKGLVVSGMSLTVRNSN